MLHNEFFINLKKNYTKILPSTISKTNILLTFRYTKLHANEQWIKEVVKYISKHIWADTRTASDIWNGRWTRHMWEDALADIDEKVRTKVDITKCRKWIRDCPSHHNHAFLFVADSR